MTYLLNCLVVGLCIAGAFGAARLKRQCVSSVVTRASVRLESYDQDNHVTGDIQFDQQFPGMPVTVRGTIRGLSPGLHGFHVHQLGSITGGCAATGGHFNPFGRTHGSPTNSGRHVGDLGNINADEDGTANVDITDAYISINGPPSIVGRALVVHARADDLGKGNDAESLRTGNAGGRVACGVIGRSVETEVYRCGASG